MSKHKVSRKDLKRQLKEALAGQVHTCHFADAELHKASQKVLMGSAVILTLETLGGRTIIGPVMIRDGLNEETIVSLRNDIHRSYEIATLFNRKEQQHDPEYDFGKDPS